MLLLVLAMLFSLLGGCSGNTAETSEAASTAVTTDQAAAPSGDAAAAGAVQGATQGADTNAAAVSLPILEDETTYTMWSTIHPACVNYISDPATDQAIWGEIKKLTNINFEFTAVNGMSESEKYNLMIATGDYPDVISCMDNYSSGIEAAIDDSVIVDLNDKIKEYCPTYWGLISNDAEAYMALSTDSGYMGTIATLYTEDGTNEIRGNLLRQDWLDEFGMETPGTFDELYSYLKKANETYGAHMEFATTGNDSLATGYNVNPGGYTVVDGKVQICYLEDSYYDYVTMAAKWYKDGIIDPDFYGVTDLTQNASKMANGEYALASGTVLSYGTISSYITDKDSGFSMVGVKYATPNKDDQLHVGTTSKLIQDDDTWAISTACEDPVPLLKLVEYMYSDEGQLLFNYGVKGSSYELDTNGEPQWTDLILNNPDGMNFSQATQVYAFATVPSIYDSTKENYNFSDAEWAALKTFKGMTDGAYNYPDYATLTADESAQYSVLDTDIATYAEEALLDFITGEKELTEESWGAFVSKLSEMGINEMLQIKQDAYDRAMKKYDELTK